MCDNHKPTQGRRRILYSQQSQKNQNPSSSVFPAYFVLCYTSEERSFGMCLTPGGRLQAGRLSQEAGLGILPVARGLGNGTW